MKYLTAVLLLSIIIISLNNEIIAQYRANNFNDLELLHLETEFHNSLDSLFHPANYFLPILNKSTNHGEFLLSEEINQFGDGSNWFSWSEHAYKYNSDNKLILKTTFERDESDWNYWQRVHFAYDSFDNLIEERHSWWDETKWSTSERKINTYDDNNNKIKTIVQWLDETKWRNDRMTVLTYSEANNIVGRFFSQWRDSKWENVSNIYYSYDINQNLIEFLQEHVDELGIMNNYWKSLYSYNDNKLIEAISYDWYNFEWQKIGRSFYSYNGDKMIERIGQGYRDSVWVNSSKSEFIYNLSGNLIEHHYYIWIDSTWQINTKETYTYDSYQNLTRHQSLSFDDSILVYEIAKSYSYITRHNSTLEDSRYILINNYPNPFNPNTTIQFQLLDTDFITLKVYNALGKEITTLVNEEKLIGIHEFGFNATGLTSGVYFYRLQAGDFSETKKMIYLK